MPESVQLTPREIEFMNRLFAGNILSKEDPNNRVTVKRLRDKLGHDSIDSSSLDGYILGSDETITPTSILYKIEK